MSRSSLFVAAAAALVAALAGGCVTTSIVDTWQNPALVATAQPKKALVAAQAPDEALRRRLEFELSQQLQSQGVQAIPVSNVSVAPRELDRNALNQVASQQGADTVIVSRFTGLERSYSFSPGAYGWNVGWSYPTYYGVWGTSADWYGPPLTISHVETSAYDVNRGGQLVWTATSETTGEPHGKSAVSSIAKKVVDGMQQDGVIPPGPETGKKAG